MFVANRMIRRPLSGMGMGSVLLNQGGAGGGSSYASIPEYEDTTGRQIRGGNLGEKLARLSVKPLVRKPQPIRF
tara:strand:+ start:68 stop:289 length:222 start_codon:yes stop_codon:yes gene_type:complete